MDNTIKELIIKQNMQHIVKLETQIHKLVALLDLGISNVYDRDDTIGVATALSDTLGQADADLVAIMNLLSN